MAIEGPVVSIEDSTINAMESTSKEYLDLVELFNFTKETPTLTLTETYPPPFETLDFNKVIAYDFDGRGEYNSTVCDMEGLGYASVIIRQSNLTIESVDELISLLTDKSTYGGRRNACYEPHLGFIFYKAHTVKAVIDICLDCNFLKSTLPIPIISHKMITYETGETQPLDGFSGNGVDRIVALSTYLNLDYSTFEK